LRKFHTDTPVKPGDAVDVIIGDTDSDAEVDRPATDSSNRSDDGSVINADNAGVSNDTDGRTETEAINAECGGDVEREVGDSHLPEFVTGQQLSDEQNNELAEILTEFSDVFDSNPGRTDLITHHIQLTDHRPCWQPPYPIRDSMRDAVENELGKMEENGLIEIDTETKYNSPLVIVRKKDNGIRLVNNFIKLNENTVQEKYQMANANEIIYKVAGAKIITKLDLTSFFYQIPLAPECRHYTGFYTPFGTYHYNVLAQGLCGAPRTSQKLIDRILRGCHRYASALQDDIVIYSTTWENHLIHLRNVLQRLRDAGLTANVKKCIRIGQNKNSWILC